MLRPEEQLACAIARHHFGPIIGEVARILLLKPGCVVAIIVADSLDFFDKHFQAQGTTTVVTSQPAAAKSPSSSSPSQSNGSTATLPSPSASQPSTPTLKTAFTQAERVRHVRNALTVLIQHDLCYAREASSVTGTGTGTGTKPDSSSPPSPSANTANTTSRPVSPFEYFLLIDKVLCRPRVPLYVGFARMRFGSVGDLVLRTLFQRGRMTSHMLFSLALDKALAKMSVSVADAEACLTDMARCGLLKWSCRRFSRRRIRARSRPSSSSTTNGEGEKAGGIANNNSNATENSTDASPKVGEKRKRAETATDDNDNDNDKDDDEFEYDHTDVLRIDYADPENSDSDSDSDDEGRVTIGRGRSSRKVGIPSRDNDSDVWTISYWHLNREFRNECCVKVAQTRVYDEVACAILRIGLQLALDGEDCYHPSEDFETTDVATEDIQAVLEQRDGTISASSFWESIQVLTSQIPAFVLPIPEHAPTKLRFIPGRLVAEARQKTLEEFVATRYQPAGRRVFQALAIDGGMEEKMLADKCMLHIKVVRALVYKLYEENLVSLQEVSRSHDATQRSNNWYYIWTVNILAALRNLTQVLYKTSFNLFTRLDALDTRLAGMRKRSRTSRDEMQNLEKQRQVLVGNILRIDQSIMVMRDFGPLSAAYFASKYKVIDGPVGIVRKSRRGKT